MNLVLIEPHELDDRGRVRLDDERARHLLGVLNVAPEQTVRVGLIDAGVGSGRVTSIEDDAITLDCTFGDPLPRPRADLLLALPRPKVLRRLWPQIAALGVGRIMLTNASRVERNYFDAHVIDPAVYRPLLIEGLQQTRDTRLPLVTVHRQFRLLVEDDLDALSGAGRRLVADPASATRIRDAVDTGAEDRVLLAVGPEGGWNQFELNLLRAHGFVAVGMGTRTLRSDTACIALLTLVHDAIAASG